MRNVTPNKKAPAKKKPGPKKKSPAKKTPRKKQKVPAKKPATRALVKQDEAVLSLENYVRKRNAIMTFIKSHLVEGKDHGKMWDKDEKKNIYISGCEKVTNWLQLRPRYFPDLETWAMLGKPTGVVLYTVYLVQLVNISAIEQKIRSFGTDHEEMVYRLMAETTGKGGASLKEGRVFDENSCAKKAKIRSTKDAVLALGLHSEFTQDYELYENEIEENGKEAEEAYIQPKKKVPSSPPSAGNSVVAKAKKPKSKPPTPPPTPAATASEKTCAGLRDRIFQLLAEYGFPEGQKKILRDRASASYRSRDAAALSALIDSVNRQGKHIKP